MFSGLPFYCCVEQFLALKNLVEVSKLVQHELLNYKSHCIFFTKPYKGRHNFSHIYLFLRIHGFQDPGFLGSNFFWVQIFQGPGPGFRSSPWKYQVFCILSARS